MLISGLVMLNYFILQISAEVCNCILSVIQDIKSPLIILGLPYG